MQWLETSILKPRQVGIYVTTPCGIIRPEFQLLEPLPNSLLTEKHLCV